MMITSRTYFSLGDLVGAVFSDDDVSQALDLGEAYKDNNGTALYQLISYYFEDATLEAFWAETRTSTDTRPQYMNVLFCQYIYPKYKDMFITYYDDSTEASSKKMKAFRYILNNIRTHYDEYTKLISLYEDIKDNLLDSINTVSKLNLTPQTVNGVYDDSYLNQVNTTESDVTSKIGRLAEVSALIEDFYSKWAYTVCKGFFYDM